MQSHRVIKEHVLYGRQNAQWPPMSPPTPEAHAWCNPSLECEKDMPLNMMGYYSHAYVVLYVKRDFIEGIKVLSQLTLS